MNTTAQIIGYAREIAATADRNDTDMNDLDYSPLRQALADLDSAATVIVVAEINWERVDNLLVNAIEGGSTYWAGDCLLKKGQVQPKPGAFGEDAQYPWYSVAFRANVVMRVSEQDDDGKEWHDLSRTTAQRGLQLMADKYPHHYADFINENDDANTADIFLQLATLGEVRYG